MAALKRLKSWVYPVTPFTIVTLLGIAVAIQSIYIGLTYESPMILYPIMVIPIVVFIFAMYVLDRFFIKSTPYHIIFVIELVLCTVGYIGFKYMNSTNDIHFTTDKEYILIIYDVKENSMDRFSKTDLFSKELKSNENVIHLDQSLYLSNKIRIFSPDRWNGGFQDNSYYFYQGDSIPYLYMSNSHSPKDQKYTEQQFIDSLLTQEMAK
ncbi:hypothetical protein RBH94_02325 [Aestuariibaculum sp. YM273]|uniref:hypothetical protein n=1 Tax=Aestuariibaculum sp. YM273 TaxID=3070659 RepID=UPI0027DB23D6|nr:hypothetical protein [Aestuariibaculum sp. YM273]WMI66004.1 hypothetical protein RBH94_02325 [Aestuariibaculum sp. YM273]